MTHEGNIKGAHPVMLAKLLVDLEVEKLGGARGGAYVPRTSERSNYQVLLPHEIDAIRKSGTTDIDASLIQAGVDKLVKTRVLWSADNVDEQPEKTVFLEDTNPGLTALEEDIVHLQAEAFLRGDRYSSSLVKVDELERMRKRMENSGKYSKHGFIKEVLELAAIRDDKLDISSMQRPKLESLEDTEDKGSGQIKQSRLLEIDPSELNPGWMRFADIIATHIHQAWRVNVWAKDKNRNPGGKHPRFEEVKDPAVIEAIISARQDLKALVSENPEKVSSNPVEVGPNIRLNVKRDEKGGILLTPEGKPVIIVEENIDVPYGELSETGKRANKAAGIDAAQVVRALESAAAKGIIKSRAFLREMSWVVVVLNNFPQDVPGLGQGFYYSSPERRVILEVGQYMHAVWLARNSMGVEAAEDTVTQNQREPDFLKLNSQNQRADLQMVQIALKQRLK